MTSRTRILLIGLILGLTSCNLPINNLGDYTIRKYTDTLATTCSADSITLWIFHDKKTENGFSDTLSKILFTECPEMRDSLQIFLEVEYGSYKHNQTPHRTLNVTGDSISLIYSARYVSSDRSLDNKKTSNEKIELSPIDDFYHIYSIIIKHSPSKNVNVDSKTF